MTARLASLAIGVTALISTAVTGWASTGTVLDTDGKPVPNARVWAFLGEVKHSRRIPLTTDKSGHFDFTPPVTGRYYYLADAEGYGYAMACDPKGGSKDITITLWPETTVHGLVTDIAGKPIAGATVGIHDFDAWETGDDVTTSNKPWIWFRDQPAFAGTVKTDSEGWFTIGHIPDMSGFSKIKFRLEATAPGRAPSGKFFTKAEALGTPTLVLYRACTLSGKVLLPRKSDPAPETVGVRVSYSDGSYDDYRSAFLDENGCFCFKDIPQGPVRITVGEGLSSIDGSCDQPLFGALTSWSQPNPIKITLLPGKAKRVEIVLDEAENAD